LKTKKLNTYPIIYNILIESLERDFPNKLPEKQISDYDLGFLIGQQDIINKLKFEQKYIQNEITDDEEFIDIED